MTLSMYSVLTVGSTPLKHTRTLLPHAVDRVDQLGNEQLHQTVPTITTLNPSGAVLGILERGAMEEPWRQMGAHLTTDKLAPAIPVMQ